MKNPYKKKISLQMVSILFACLGLFTLIPWASADHASILGYYALCPFSPISTVILLYLARIVYGHIRRIENRT